MDDRCFHALLHRPSAAAPPVRRKGLVADLPLANRMVAMGP